MTIMTMKIETSFQNVCFVLFIIEIALKKYTFYWVLFTEKYVLL